MASDAVRRILPRSWWNALRRLKRRSRYLSSPRAMERLRGMKRRGFSPAVVVDVGAARGDWTASCRSLFPEAHFVLVEPFPEHEAELTRLAERWGVRYVKAAAGRERSTLSLLVPDDPGGASFLPAQREGDTFFKHSIEVPVVPLDGLQVEPGATLLKLDVQGYELEVLAGAGRLLEQVEVIVCECSLYPFQRGLPLVHQTIERILSLGFRLYDVADEVRWTSGTLAQVDLVFVASGSQLLQPRWWS
jgi:FkbM family methyltransferase